MVRPILLLGCATILATLSPVGSQLPNDGGARPISDGVKVFGVVVGTVVTKEEPKGVKKPAPGAAVHLRDLPPGWKPAPSADPVELKFTKGRLVPEFACLQVGQKLLVKCPEGELFSLVAHSRERGEFGRLLPPDLKVFTDSFPEPDDFVSLVCVIHPTARAHLQVVPTPGFVLCDGEGKFALPKRLPKGEHVLKGFYPGMGWAEKTITLRGDEGEITVELELAPRKTKTPK